MTSPREGLAPCQTQCAMLDGRAAWDLQDFQVYLETDDPNEANEAKAAFERGREYVRTGRME